MQNMFTGEHQARIVIETRHAEARQHDMLKVARAGQPRQMPVATVMTSLGIARERLLAATRRNRVATSQPACQPGMAC